MIPSTLFDYTNIISDKPISFGCLNPIALKNSDGTVKFVPCRHCVACRLKQMFRLSSSAQYEIFNSAAVAFVTLTYRNSDIPKAFYHVDKTLNRILFCDEDGVILSDEKYFPNFEKHLNKISFNYAKRFPNYFRGQQVPYLNKEHITKYLKRIRVTSVRKGFDSKYFPIRYLLCGEYGESFARPHFHLLLFFNSVTQYQEFAKSCAQKWYYGNCYLRKFTGKGANYLSSYTVGSSADSYFYGRSFAKQFVRHSCKLGFNYFEKVTQIDKKVSPLSASFKNDVVFTEFGQLSVVMPYNYKSSLFSKPRCSNFFTDWFSKQCDFKAISGLSSCFERLKLTFLKLLPFRHSVSEVVKYILSHDDCIYYSIFGHYVKNLSYRFAYNRVYYDCRNSAKFLQFAKRFYDDNIIQAFTAYVSFYNITNFINYSNNQVIYNLLCDIDTSEAAYYFSNSSKRFFESSWFNTLSFQNWENYCNLLASKYSKQKKQKHLYTLKDYE